MTLLKFVKNDATVIFYSVVTSDRKGFMEGQLLNQRKGNGSHQLSDARGDPTEILLAAVKYDGQPGASLMFPWGKRLRPEAAWEESKLAEAV